MAGHRWTALFSETHFVAQQPKARFPDALPLASLNLRTAAVVIRHDILSLALSSMCIRVPYDL